MEHSNRWMVTVLIMAGLILTACTPTSIKASKIPPVKVENIEGTNLKRLTLIPEAAKRLEIQTTPVREEPVVRQRKVGGEVVALPATLAFTTTSASSDSSLRVRVTLNESDLKMVDRSKPALVLPLGGNTGADRLDSTTGRGAGCRQCRRRERRAVLCHRYCRPRLDCGAACAGSVDSGGQQHAAQAHSPRCAAL